MDTTIVNLSNLETTILFVLGVLAALVAVDKGVEAFRHLFLRRRSGQEASQNDRLNHVERVEAAHQTRLDAGDRKFDRLSADMSQLLKVQNALLMHEITGNGIEKLKTVKSELDTYLTTRN
ncbi:MAG TPA: hypothetical protein OIM07_04605 [Clostridiales bacterium]|nr:hypothetical protein [Clostridiales bacterium]